MKLVETDTAVLVEPDIAPRASVIWLHGLGADGHDFVPIVRELGLKPDAALRFVFPHAPVRPVTLNNGFPMRAWFDIRSLDRKGLADEAGIAESAARVRSLIAAETAAGIPAGRIVVAGFSQGGAIALHTVLRHPERLAGLLALSTYLPLADTLPAQASAANRDVPILLCHGSDDPILPLELGEWSRDRLTDQGYAVEWQAYPMAHEVCAEQIERIGAWLGEVLPD